MNINKPHLAVFLLGSLIISVLLVGIATPAVAQDSIMTDSLPVLADSLPAAATAEELIGADDMAALEEMAGSGSNGLHLQLKTKFVEGSPGFMSLVALALIIGLALCIERIIYLSLAEVNAKKLLTDIEKKLADGKLEEAKTLCRETRGPVASICYQGLMHFNDSPEDIERSITSYGSLQTSLLEKGCSWIKLMIAIAPSLGFLGTVIGMVMAFDQIQEAGDMSASIVASGMKVALITTIFGIIVALVLQLFYNFILSRIDRITAQMEESAIDLMDIVKKVKSEK